MTPEERRQFALAEYEVFVIALQQKYGVLIKAYRLSKDYGDGIQAPDAYGVDALPLSDWQPPETDTKND